MKIDSVKISPDPPKKGENVNVTASATTCKNTPLLLLENAPFIIFSSSWRHHWREDQV